MKITGLDKLTKQLEEAQKAFADIDGELGTVSFDPSDPSSIELAINSMNDLVDQRVGRYAANPLVAPLIDAMKEQYRSAILEQAAAARLKGNDE